MSIQERLQMILKMHNMSPSAFADKLGVQRSNVSHVLSGRNKPSLDFLEKIITQFPRVNAHWLISGQMPKNQTSNNQTEEEGSYEVTRNVERGNVQENEIIKIIELYKDGSFKEFKPRKQ